MANKSSKSFSGEEREQPGDHVRKQEVDAQDIRKNTGTAPSNTPGNQENLKNRGYQEDQPGNPVRNTGSMREDQETLPTGEPDPNEI
jgi:hypothetical protein